MGTPEEEEIACTSSLDDELGALVLALKGDLDLFSFDALKAHLEKWKDDDGHRHLLIDMRKVNYVGSSGWAVLLTHSAAADAKQGLMVLYGLSNRLRRSWHNISGAGRMLKIVSTYDEAVAMLKGSV